MKSCWVVDPDHQVHSLRCPMRTAQAQSYGSTIIDAALMLTHLETHDRKDDRTAPGVLWGCPVCIPEPVDD